MFLHSWISDVYRRFGPSVSRKCRKRTTARNLTARSCAATYRGEPLEDRTLLTIFVVGENSSFESSVYRFQDNGVFETSFANNSGILTTSATNGTDVFVGDRFTDEVRRYTPSGTFLGVFADTSGIMGSGSSGVLDKLEFDNAGNLYASPAGQSSAPRISLRYNTSGTVTAQFSHTSLLFPAGIDADAAGNVYIANSAAVGVGDELFKFNSSGTFLGNFDIDSQVATPTDLAIDQTGQKLYVADESGGTNGVKVYDISSGTPSFTGSIATPGLAGALGISFDEASGHLLVSGYNGTSIEVATNGTVIATYAHTSTALARDIVRVGGGDTTLPTVANRVPTPSSTITSSSTNIDVTFSETVTGVDATDLVLTGTAATSAVRGVPTNVGSNTWRFPVSGLVNGTLNISLAPDANDIEDTAGNDLANIIWNYIVTISGGTGGTFSNNSAISIPDSGSSTPYPSNITVSGLSGAITDVNVTLAGLSHTYPDDIDILLVGPGGQSVILLSDVSGGSPGVSNLTLTLDDAAASTLPDEIPFTTGTFKPTNFGSSDSFPAPAPSGTPTGTALSVFNGTPGNGTWSLYVFDDAGGDFGSIAGGWSITLTTNPQPTVNLSVSAATGTESGATAITVTATASAAVIGDQTIFLTVSGTGIDTGDYVLSNSTITIPNGGQVGTVTFTVKNDTLLEGSETATLTIANPSTGLTLGGTTTQNITITDNESATVAIAPTSTVTEAGGSQGVGLVTLSIAGSGTGTFALGSGISITANVTDATSGSATSGSDYNVFGTQAVTFDSGALSGATRITTLTTINDTLLETSETINLQLGNLGGSTVAKSLGNTLNVTAVVDNDTATADLSVATHGNETGPVSIVYTVTLSKTNNTGSAISFDLNDAGTGTATAGSDYTAIIANATISIAAGASTGTLTVAVIDDAVSEAAETVIAEISNSSSAAVTIGTAAATADISDNEIQSLVVSSTNVSVTEGLTHTFTVRLAFQPTGNVTVDVARVSGDNDLSVSGGGSLTFNTTDWNAPQIVTLAAAEDADLTNGSAVFDVTSAGLSTVNVTGTEFDNDLLGTLSMTVSVSTIGEADVTPSTTGTVTRSGDLTNSLTVTLTSSDDTEVWVPLSVIIAAGQTSAVFNIESVNDGLTDGTQSATITASTSGYVPGVETVDVTDDDTVSMRTLGGHLHGTVAVGTYHVLSDIVVDPGRVLLVEPSSALLFAAGSGITINGTLTAEGDAGSEIVFTSVSGTPAPGDWKGISLPATSMPRSILDYIDVAYAERGIDLPSVNDPHLTLTNSRIHHNLMDGVRSEARHQDFVIGDDVLIDGNQIHDNGGAGIAIIAVGSSNSTGTGSQNSSIVTRNTIFNNDGFGVYIAASYAAAGGFSASVFSSPMVERNFIHGNAGGIQSHAFKTNGAFGSGSSSPTIYNNLILDNTGNGIDFSRSGEGRVTPLVINNTLAGNGGAGIFHEANLLPFESQAIRNNIVVGNNTGMQSDVSYTPLPGVVSFNDVYGNSGGDWVNYPATFGSLTTTNALGTPADVEMNISADPEFVGGGDYHLLDSSPAVNSGTATGAPATDFEGDSRLGSVDIGYDEVLYVQHLIVSSTSLSVTEGLTNTFTVRLAFQPTGNVTVNVARVSGDNDLSVSGGGSLTFNTTDWNTPQTVTLSAAEDVDLTNGSSEFDVTSAGLATVNVTGAEIDNDVQSFIVSSTTGSVAEGSSNTFTVELAFQPPANVTVDVARYVGDTDISVSSSGSLTFNTTNWNMPQTVTLAAAEDTDIVNGTAVFRVTSTGVTTVDVTVTEVDNDASFSFNAGMLTVVGTALDDAITVFNHSGSIKIDHNGTVIDTGLTASSVMRVMVSGVGGNDTLQLDNSLGANVPGTLLGGDGDDILIGSLSNDTLVGGSGTDSLNGGANDDSLTIDNLDTTVIGGTGYDRVTIVNAVGMVTLNLFAGQIEYVSATTSTFNNVFDAMGATWAVSIYGGSGNDTITGGDGNDTLIGNAGDDVIVGNGGLDKLNGGLGADSLNGGANDDSLTFDNLDTTVIGGAGYDRATVAGANGLITLNLFAGQLEYVSAATSTFNNVFNATGATSGVSIYGGSGNDTLTGGDGNDVLSGNDGDDVIVGNGGHDKLIGGTGADSLNGGADDDSLTIDNLDTTIFGGVGYDRVTVSGATEAINLNLFTGQIEYVSATSSAFDNVFDATGTISAVLIYGGLGNDTITGGDGNDMLNGNAGDDVIVGNGGHDKLIGGLGADSLNGGANDDSLTIDNLDTTVFCGAGYDRVTVSGATAAINLNLFAGQIEYVSATSSTFNNVLDATGATWAVSIYGGSGNDTITGGDGNDLLNGNAGADTIVGSGGLDKLIGGLGPDSLNGGADDDILTIDNDDISVVGGLGYDRVSVSGATAAVTLDLFDGQIEYLSATTSTFNNVFDATGATWDVTILGGTGNDTLIGGDGNDTLNGRAGNDLIIGNGGHDRLLGDIGIDTISYVTAGSSVNVNLMTKSATGSAGNDTLNSIENVTGSNFDDLITGDPNDNTLDGRGGLDIIFGGGGIDIILNV